MTRRTSASSFKTLLKKNGYDVEVADGGEAALERIDAFGPDVILTDVRMPKMGGLDLLATLQGEAVRGDGHRDERVRQHGPRARSDEGRRVRLRVASPSSPTRSCSRFVKRKSARRCVARTARCVSRFGKTTSSSRSSPRARRCSKCFGRSTKIADFKTTVLVSGESGVGKELVAKAIHARSSRKGNAPFVAVNCGAIPENLLESELFGHKKGAFTDANADRRVASSKRPRGARCSSTRSASSRFNLQVKLLRALQEETIRRLGDTKDVKVDVRIITATHRDLVRRSEGRALPRRPLLPNQRPADHSSRRYARGAKTSTCSSITSWHAQQRAPRHAASAASPPTRASS